MVLALLVAGVAAVVVTSGISDVDTVRGRVGSAGPIAPAVFAVVFALAMLAPLPKNALSAAGGLLFGLTTGVLAVWVGAMLGALVAFWLARALGREVISRFTGPRVARADELVRRGGVLAARLVPVVPFTLINYASGLGPVRFAHYLLGTAIGILPGSLAYVAVGAYGTQPRSWQLYVAVAALVALSVGGVVVARRRGPWSTG